MEPQNNPNDPFITIEPTPRGPRWGELKTRIASSAVLLAVTIGIWWLGGWVFTLFVVLAAQLMVKEWNGLTEAEGASWRLFGLFYAAVPCASLIWLREVRFEGDAQAGLWLVLYVLLCVWATDIGAYFVGRKVGGAKLAPSISPGKTWAGLGGGVGAAFIVGGLAHFFTPYPTSIVAGALLAALIALVAQGGDLFESWLKRRAGVKDSGTLIPGHGGLLDRVDGLVFTLPLFALAVALSGYAQ
jgi:phosphatidate cytidylyltransferase